MALSAKSEAANNTNDFLVIVKHLLCVVQI